MPYYRRVVSDAWEATQRFAKHRGIWWGLAAAVLGVGVTALLIGEFDRSALVSAVGGPLLFFMLAYLLNVVRAPSRLDRRRHDAIESLEEVIRGLEAEKLVMLKELIPGIRLDADNTAEYGCELEIDILDRASNQRRQERRKAKLVKVVNESSQSLVVNAQIVQVDPPIIEGAGPPIRLRWRESPWGNHTLSPHECDYVVVSPPIPDIELWAQTDTRTVTVSVWVQGHTGAMRRFRLENLLAANQYPRIAAF